MSGEGLLIVVPARGGSKELPRKNAALLGGIPLLEWTVEAVRRAGLSKATCILSTDDRKIADIGRSVGIDVPFLRPAELATDTATLEAVALHVLDWLGVERGIAAKSVMLLQPTSPFRIPEALTEAVSMLEDPTIDAVFGVKPIHRSPAVLFHANERMELTPLGSGNKHNRRRQDVNTLFTPSGTLYLVRSKILRKVKSFFPKKCRGIAMDQIASIDIDDPVDWKIAEAIARSGLTWRG